jgi:hypothetical protein
MQTRLVKCSHPNVEFDVFVGHRFDVETDRGNGVDGLAELQLVQDRRLSGGVQTKHQDSHFLVAENCKIGGKLFMLNFGRNRGTS